MNSDGCELSPAGGKMQSDARESVPTRLIVFPNAYSAIRNACESSDARESPEARDAMDSGCPSCERRRDDELVAKRRNPTWVEARGEGQKRARN